jgi:Aspartyl protease
LVRSVILLFAVSASLGAATAARAEEKCGPPKIVNQVQMTRLVGSNMDLVPFTINGREMHFLFDTGGALTQIGQTAARSLGLIVQPGNMEIYDVRGNVSNSMAAVPQFVLGHQHGTHGIFPVTANLDAVNPDPFDGIFALDYVQNFDVEMDFGTDLLNVFSSDHCPGQVSAWGPSYVAVIPFTVEDRHIFITVMLDGHPLKALVDTGTAKTSLRIDLAESQYGLTLGAADTPEDGVLNGDATLKTYRHVFGEMSFDDIAVPHPHITIFPNVVGVTSDHWRQVRKLFQVDIANAPQLIIGMDVLRQLRLYMAFGESKLYISPASAPAAANAKAT